MDLRLTSLTLENFKGVRSYTLSPNGSSVTVAGENETGKTTLTDAFHWLLFDKDSRGRAEFGIKTTQDGAVLHNLDHSVEGVFEGGPTLKKTYRETYTKKRGSATESFTGHTTDHYVDGVPVSATEYRNRIAQILSEERFRLLTDPHRFNALPWTERRAIVMEVCGDVADSDVIGSDKKLARLTEILEGRSIEDHKKVLAAKRKEINEELERIPTRIDEVNRNLPDAPEMDEKAIESRLKAIANRLGALEEDAARIKAGGQAAALKAERAQAESELAKLDAEERARVAAADDGSRQKHREKVEALKDSLAAFDGDISRAAQEITSLEDGITERESKMADMRVKWGELNEKVFESTEATVCPTCERPLPEDEVAAARERAEADFNRSKAETLESITASGKAFSEEQAEAKASLEAETSRLESLKDDRSKAQVELEALQGTTIEEDKPDEGYLLRREAYVAQIAHIDKRIRQASDGFAPDLAEIEGEATDKKAEADALRADRESWKAIRRGRDRIDELEGEQRCLAAAYEQIEGDIFLTEEFTRAKVAMIEEKVADHFDVARFRLFEVQVNGGLKECCDTLYKGVPYEGGLNNAGQITVGLDIIKTLSRHYGVSAPIFLDNAEAITKIPKMDAQTIALYVKRGVKTLEVK